MDPQELEVASNREEWKRLRVCHPQHVLVHCNSLCLFLPSYVHFHTLIPSPQ